MRSTKLLMPLLFVRGKFEAKGGEMGRETTDFEQTRKYEASKMTSTCMLVHYVK